VDAAYGGPAILSAEYADALRPIAEADSVALDPHKWLFVPVEAGLVFVRDADAMRSAFSLVPPYIRQSGSAGAVYGLPWFSEYGFQQTRGFRALKVWMALKHQGLSGYREAINHDLMMAGRLAEAVRKSPVLQLLQPQNLSIVCFRYAPPAMRHDAAALDATNRGLLDRLQLGGRAFLSGTVIDDTFWLRACITELEPRRPRTKGHPIAVAEIDEKVGSPAAVWKERRVDLPPVESSHRAAVQTQRTRRKDQVPSLQRSALKGHALPIGLRHTCKPTRHFGPRRRQLRHLFVETGIVGHDDSGRGAHCLVHVPWTEGWT